MTSRRYVACLLTLGVVTGSILVGPLASAGPVDDSVTTTALDQSDTFFFPQGSAAVGPAVIGIDTVIADVGELKVVLDTVALLAQITAPFGVRG